MSQGPGRLPTQQQMPGDYQPHTGRGDLLASASGSWQLLLGLVVFFEGPGPVCTWVGRPVTPGLPEVEGTPSGQHSSFSC